MSEQSTSHAYITPELETTTRTIYSEEYFAASNGSTMIGSRNVTMTRTGVGRWDVTITPAHPHGVNYHVSFEAEEQSANRDAPDITIVQGSKTASSFSIQITTGDNGGTADVYIDTPFTLAIDAPVDVITTAALGGAGGLAPATGVLVSDNFQDGNGNAPFNLQVRNTTGNPTTWAAVVRDVPYATIPSLNAGQYTLNTTGTGPYTHTFTGTTPLGAYANITITGGAPSPAGVGTANGNPELYL